MTATITLSLEIELGWGFHDKPSGTKLFSDRCEVEHKTLDRLLEVCDTFDVPVSFDIVGFLLNPPGHGSEESPHPNNWWPSAIDDGMDAHLYYAPNIIQRIRNAVVDHEICTHTYTHIPCAEFTDEVLDWELGRVRDVHQQHRLEPPKSIVPPRHSPPSRDVLRGNGIECLRVPATEPPASKVASFIHYLTRNHPIRDPNADDGILESYTSMNTSLTAPYLQNGQKPPHPTFRVLPRRIRQRIHRRYLNHALERAIDENSYAHLWTHLFNISNDVQFPLVRDFLKILGNKQKQGEARVVTMKNLIDDPS
jgi:peptidoglycan/xylan/chitin deacetylase (PgdA/CDA1 family)